MTVNQSQNKKKKRARSFLVTWITRLIAFISALFLKSWVGRAIMKSGSSFNNSFIRRWFVSIKTKTRKRSGFVNKLSLVCENGFFARLGRSVVSLMTTMSVAVYGMFFATFGIVTIIIHFIAIYVIPNSSYDGEISLIAGVILVICSIPFLSSTRSVIQLFACGKAARRIAIGFLRIPEEKLWNQKKIGGVAFMLLSAFLGMMMGALTYFVNPLFVIAALVVFVAVILVFSYPEGGVIISCITLPFLQYISYVDLVMLALVLLTGISYAIKFIRGKRTFHMSAMDVMVVLLGIAMIIAGMFSPGGKTAIAHSIYNVMIIWGAFFLGGNLTKNDSVRKICVKILIAALVVSSFLQFWNLYYMNISEAVEHSLETDYRSILDTTGLNTARNLKIPGLWAAMLSPMLIAECFNRKRIYSVVALLLGFVPVVLSIAFFGTLEIMIALLIGVALYLILHSPKSVTNILIVTLCCALIFMLLPIVLSQLGVHNIPTFGDVIEIIFPDGDELSAYRSHIVKDTWNMLCDGNIFGIGSGTEAYKNAMAPYVTAVSENADTPAIAYFQILCESGIVGLIIFASFSVLILKNGMKYVINPKSRQSKTLLLGMISGYMTALILGSVSCIFVDVQMRYLFWLFAGLIVSQVYSGEANELLSNSRLKDNADEVDVIERG